jgi:D-3-phosphoglycerate dehydrogenase / 2-oxoglutarate reductase
MPVILLTNYYSRKLLNSMKRKLPSGFKIISLDKVCKDELIEKAGMADYIFAGSNILIDKEVLDAAPRLKMVQKAGVGTDVLNLKALKKKNIPVYIIRNKNSSSIAEHTLMLMLSVLRRLTEMDAGIKKGIWQKQDNIIQCSELSGKTVGLVGMRDVGREVARLLKAFNVRLLYHDTIRLKEDMEKDLNIEYFDMTKLLRRADILSFQCPLNFKTKGMIGTEEIKTMKPGSIVINTSSRALIDEEALAYYLRIGYLKGAGLDVFSNEALPQDNPLLKLDNVIFTPHTGGATFESFKRMMREVMQNIKLFEEGETEKLENKRLKF